MLILIITKSASTEKLDEDDPDPIAKQHVPPLETPGGQEVRHADRELIAAEEKYGSPQAIANHLSMCVST